MKVAFKIAVRFLKSNIAQTSLIIVGIAVGVSVQIFIGSLIGGLQNGLIDKTIGNSSQITVKVDQGTFTNYKEIVDKIKEENVKYVVPVFDNNAILQVGSKSSSLLIRGLSINEADKIYDIKKSIKEGVVPTNDNEIILGIDLKEEYKLELNDEIALVDKSKNTILYKVIGFFDLGVSSINKLWGITTLKSSQMIFGQNEISAVEIQVDNNKIFETDLISKDIKKNLEENYVVSNWKEDNASLLSGLQGQSISSLMIQIFVMISVVLGISSVLAITVLQKSKQIGILKAMGLKNKMSLYIFIFEGLILGVFGATLGVLLGYLLSLSFTIFAVNADGTPVIDLFIDYNFIMISYIVAILACLVSSIIPARKSSKLNPIDIIRNN